MENVIEIKSALDEIRSTLNTKVTALDTEVKQIQCQLDAVDTRMQTQRAITGGSDPVQDIIAKMQDDGGFKSLLRSGKGRTIVEVGSFWPEQKSVLTSGSLPAVERIGGIALATGRRRLTVRDLIRTEPTDTGSVSWIEETSFTNMASPQVEATAKSESTSVFTPRSGSVKTLAHWSQISKQCLDDVVELGDHLNNTLLYGLGVKGELEILAGDGTGVHQNGLITQATVFDVSLLGTLTWNRADVLSAAQQQLEESDFVATAFVVHPRDWRQIQRSKSTTYEYVFGAPGMSVPKTLWDVPVVITTAITAGTFLAGDFQTGCHIRQRQDATIDISDSHAETFTSNVLTLRAEERFLLVTSRPACFVTGSFSQSPA